MIIKHFTHSVFHIFACVCFTNQREMFFELLIKRILLKNIEEKLIAQLVINDMAKFLFM